MILKKEVSLWHLIIKKSIRSSIYQRPNQKLLQFQPVPPLEGFWWQDNIEGVDYTRKEEFHWISVIRLPEFVTKEDFAWAVEEAAKKKKIDCSLAEFLTIEEGLCVQIMHLGAFDHEPDTVKKMDEYIEACGFENDFTDTRLHHEIYLSDPRKIEPAKCKTVIRHPIKKK